MRHQRSALSILCAQLPSADVSLGPPGSLPGIPSRTGKRTDLPLTPALYRLSLTLSSSIAASGFVDGDQYCLEDATQEKRFKFELKTSLVKARARPVFTDMIFMLVPGIKPDIGEMALVLYLTMLMYSCSGAHNGMLDDYSGWWWYR